jgi:hypothetical protein
MHDLIEVVKAQQKRVRAIKAYDVKSTLYVGATVDINNGNKAPQVGAIEKINRTRALVRIDGDLYDCPFGILSVVYPKSGPVEELNGIFDPRTL